VVFDYTWNLSSKSPLVKYQDWSERRKLEQRLKEKAAASSSEEIDELYQKERKERRAEIMSKLHKEHAPHLYQCLLELKGLYVKLGQVLSVTTLPVPDEYRNLFKTLQSNVPGHEDFHSIILPALEEQFGALVLQELFESIDPIPCGAASIGQAHKATIRRTLHENDDITTSDSSQTVIIKVQYPDAHWQVPADISCVGQFLQMCVYFDVVDESSATLSFKEFSRQFLAELDYDKERDNLDAIYQSSLDPNGPYQKYGVVVPKVVPDLCSPTILTMTYLPGPKLEEEAHRQLQALGIDTKKGLKSVVSDATKNLETNADATTIANTHNSAATADTTEKEVGDLSHDMKTNTSRKSLLPRIAKFIGNTIGFDSMLWAVRFARQIMLWSTAAAVNSIDAVSADYMPTRSLVPQSAKNWARDHQTASLQARRIAQTQTWIKALFETHGHQIFELALFNADPHPGNILVIDDTDVDAPSMASSEKKAELGLIDFGQCKRLTPDEQYRIATLLLNVAKNASDDEIARSFRDMGIKTKNDSTEFLANFARLMFGPLQSYHLDHDWHKNMHKQDAVTYFPNELSMVYRTSMLLRGLAVSLQWNVSVGDMWKEYAQKAVDKHAVTSTIPAETVQAMIADAEIQNKIDDLAETKPTEQSSLTAAALARRATRAVIHDIASPKKDTKLL